MKKKFFSKKKDNKQIFFNNTWEAVELIGEGSFGKVYKAKKINSKIEDFCAIKNIKIPQNSAEIANLKSEGLTDAEVREEIYQIVERCLNEIQLMQSLKESSNIVTIDDYEVIETKNKIEWNINIRMELLTPVDDYYKDNTLTNKDVLKLGIDICDALSDCKKLKIIHRDIKPDNIFISKFGSYKLGDFGIARNLERTTSGLSKKGTYNYMAPEVYKSEAYNSSVDLYSLGIVLYRFFNYNRIPFLPWYPARIKLNDREESIIKRMNGDTIEKPLNATDEESLIILKAIAYNAKERYKNPKEMAEELKNVFEKEETITLPKLSKKDIEGKQENNETESIYTDNKIQSVDKENNNKLEEDNPSEDDMKNNKELDNEIDYDKTESIYDSDISSKQEKLIEEDYDKTESIYTESTNSRFNKEIQDENSFDYDKTESIYSEKKEKNKVNLENEKLHKENSESNEKKNSVLKTNKNKKKKIMIVSATLIILLFSLALIINYFRPKEKYVQVSDYVGLTSEKAIKKLEKLNLEEKLIYKEIDDEKNYGKVIKQDIKNKKVKENSTIKLTIGVSKEKVEVPDLTNLTLEEATKKLKKLNLKISYEEIENDNIEKGKIISQMTTAKTKVNKGSTIEVLVSKGKKEKAEEKEEQKQEDKKDTTKENEQKQENKSDQNNTSNNNQQSVDNSEKNEPPVINQTIKVSGREHFKPGRTAKLTATISPSNPEGRGIVWSSSNPSVATVDQNGNVRAVANYGNCVITATISGTNISGSHSIRVLSVQGDVTGDGRVNSLDAAVVQDYIGRSVTEDFLAVGDIDKDGRITKNDSDMILSYYNSGRW